MNQLSDIATLVRSPLSERPASPRSTAARGSTAMPLARRYQVIAPLGRGGMGEVVLARRLGPAGFEKLVVLKRPLPSSSSRDLVAALIEEARLLARINHPNVCQVYDLEQAGDQFFFTMEHLEGLSMWAMLGGARTAVRDIAPEAVCGLFEQACDGLDAIHAMRLPDGGHVVHRDVSPGNLFVTERGVVKVLDLGIAKSSAAEQHTPLRRIVGKLGYMSPEQSAGLPLDPRSDLFSLGLVLHDVLQGRPPSRDRIGARAAEAIDFTAMPRPLAEVVQRAVAGQPADRFATAREMGAALHDAGRSLGGAWTPRELGAWLAEHHGPELARRRAIVEKGPASRTQILDLRSVFAGQPGALDEAGQASHGSPPTGSLTVALERSSSTVRRRRAWVIAGVTATAVGLSGGAIAHRLQGATGAVPYAATARATATTPAITAASAAPPAATAPAATAPTAAPPLEEPPPTSQTPSARAAAAPPPAVAAPRPRRALARPRPSWRPDEPPDPGRLTIDSWPFAVIRLGGRELGTTPLWRIPLPPGQYELHAATADGRRQDLGVRIEPGRERKLTLSWSHP